MKFRKSYAYHSGMTSTVSKVAREKVAMNVQHTAPPPPVPPTGGQGASQSQATDPATLERLISMLKKVLLQRAFSVGSIQTVWPTASQN